MNKKLSEEHRKKIARSMKGNSNANKKVKIGKSGAHIVQVNVNKELQRAEDPFDEYLGDVIQPNYSMAGFGTYFEKNEYHASAVKFKADAVVGQGYEIQPVGNVEQEPDAEYYKLYNFLMNANPYESFDNIIKKAWMDYEIFGNLYIETDINKKLELVAIGHVPSISVRKAGHGKKGYYQIKNSARKLSYFNAYGQPDNFRYPDLSNKPTNSILHLKNYYYQSSFYGYPDILPALSALYLDLQLLNFNTSFFENNALPNGIIVYTNSEVDESTMEKIQEYHEANLKGSDNAHRTLVLTAEGDGADVKFIDISGEKDLSFDKLHKMCRDRILTAHRLPPKIAGTITAGELGQSNQSYAEMQIFQELIIKPRQKELEFLLNRLFYQRLGIKKWKIKFNNFDYTTNKEDADYIMTLYDSGNGVIDRDEARQILNLPIKQKSKKDSKDTI